MEYFEVSKYMEAHIDYEGKYVDILQYCDRYLVDKTHSLTPSNSGQNNSNRMTAMTAILTKSNRSSSRSNGPKPLFDVTQSDMPFKKRRSIPNYVYTKSNPLKINVQKRSRSLPANDIIPVIRPMSHSKQQLPIPHQLKTPPQQHKSPAFNISTIPLDTSRDNSPEMHLKNIIMNRVANKPTVNKNGVGGSSTSTTHTNQSHLPKIPSDQMDLIPTDDDDDDDEIIPRFGTPQQTTVSPSQDDEKKSEQADTPRWSGNISRLADEGMVYMDNMSSTTNPQISLTHSRQNSDQLSVIKEADPNVDDTGMVYMELYDDDDEDNDSGLEYYDENGDLRIETSSNIMNQRRNGVVLNDAPQPQRSSTVQSCSFRTDSGLPFGGRIRGGNNSDSSVLLFDSVNTQQSVHH